MRNFTCAFWLTLIFASSAIAQSTAPNTGQPVGPDPMSHIPHFYPGPVVKTPAGADTLKIFGTTTPPAGWANKPKPEGQ